MWLNEKGRVYIYTQPLRYYNLSLNAGGLVTEATKDKWTSNGKSIMIGPECLARWEE